MLSRFSSVVLCAFMLSLPSFALCRAVSPPFPDMEHSWYGYREAVAYLQSRGSIAGYPDGLFRPRATVNRAEFLKLIFRSKGDVQPAAEHCFADVPKDAWYAPFVCAAKRRGIVSGYTMGSRILFKPEQPIVFAEAVKMIVLAYGDAVTEGGGEDWYKPYVEKLDRNNILRSSSFIPWAPISRERAADLVARYVRSDEERVLPNRSAGCGKTERAATTTLTVDGLTRSYLLTAPATADSSAPAPLIVAFHGRTNDNAQVRRYFGLDREARDAFIAYPAALSNGNGSFSWSNPGDKSSELRDIAFFDAIVKELAESSCIDMDRIFVVGHSLGAWFANSVACARGGVVRASATVGGSTTMENCTGPAAALIINNPHDALSSHATAAAMRDIRLGENACLSKSYDTEPSSLSCMRYEGCSENPVDFCPHTIDTDYKGSYYPHVWPNETAQAIMEFFRGL